MSLELEVGGAKRRELLEWGSQGGAGTDTAIFVVHGMGQQKTFETEAKVANALVKETNAEGARATARHVVAGERKLGVDGQKLGVVELELPAGDKPPRKVDIYEAYWAPLTEGEVTLRDVVSFLFRTGITSVPRAWFPRWMFGRIEKCVAVTGTSIALLATLLTIASLVVINTIVAAVLGARVAIQGGDWPSNYLIVDLSIPAAIVSVLLLLFGVMELLALQTKRFAPHDAKIETAVIWTIWLEAGVFLLGLMAAAGTMGAAIWHHTTTRHVSWFAGHFGLNLVDDIRMLTMRLAIVAIALVAISSIVKSWWLSKSFVYVTALATLLLIFGAFIRFTETAGHGIEEIEHEVIWKWAWVWALLFIVSWFARGFLVQYIGDVAAYVEPHRVDRFNALREKIKSCVFGTAEAIYRMSDDGVTPRYGKVIVVAHSLGSVIAYDTLNALLRTDDVHNGSLNVSSRTGALITFGSPLDKIAYLFAIQRNTELQEALATTVQPLLADYTVRPRWINIHSHHDIISGSLQYYHSELVPPDKRVQNVIDPDARVPFAAHVEYWENPMLWKTLLAVL
jgi:hypothetical protein